MISRFHPKADDKAMVLVSRMLILAIGVVGFIVALIGPPGIFVIVIFTTSVLGSAFISAVCLRCMVEKG